MASIRFYVCSSFALIGAAALLGGCAGPNNGSSSYPPPNTPQSSSSYQSSSSVEPSASYSSSSTGMSGAAAPMDRSMRVPTGAEMVVSGTPPLASFEVSNGGMLYIFDDNTNTVAFTTSVTDSDMSRKINLSDFQNVSLDKNHHYRVFFVPRSRTGNTLQTPSGQ